MTKKYKPFQAEPVTTTQAIGLACLLIDFELHLEQVEQPPDSWYRELREAKKVLTSLLHQSSPLPKVDYSGQKA